MPISNADTPKASLKGWQFLDIQDALIYNFTCRNLSEFTITETELMLIAAPAIMGESRIPNVGYKIPV
ncbi:MAG: hypothetical protein ITG00_01700, partial [Flavobacterium sp.]|nr:hypothetical protein [Flavobacterium sp.]